MNYYKINLHTTDKKDLLCETTIDLKKGSQIRKGNPFRDYAVLSLANFIQPVLDINRRVQDSYTFVLSGTFLGLLAGRFNVVYYFFLLNLTICLLMSIGTWIFFPKNRYKLPFLFDDNTYVPKMMGYLLYPLLGRGLDLVISGSFAGGSTAFRDIALMLMSIELMLKTSEILGLFGIKVALEVGRYLPDVKHFCSQELKRCLEKALHGLQDKHTE